MTKKNKSLLQLPNSLKARGELTENQVKFSFPIEPNANQLGNNKGGIGDEGAALQQTSLRGDTWYGAE
jgi:hypothetical protein